MTFAEARLAIVTSFVAAVLLGAFTMVLLTRLFVVPVPVAAAIAFFAFSLPLFLPLRLLRARKAAILTAGRFLLACAGGAMVAAATTFVLEKV